MGYTNVSGNKPSWVALHQGFIENHIADSYSIIIPYFYSGVHFIKYTPFSILISNPQFPFVVLIHVSVKEKRFC